MVEERARLKSCFNLLVIRQQVRAAQYKHLCTFAISSNTPEVVQLYLQGVKKRRNNEMVVKKTFITTVTKDVVDFNRAFIVIVYYSF